MLIDLIPFRMYGIMFQHNFQNKSLSGAGRQGTFHIWVQDKSDQENIHK